MMSSSLWLFGLLLGMRHALEPDHLAAVSTLAVQEARQEGPTERRIPSGALLGGMWGLGHTGALLAVATLLCLGGAAMPPRLATTFELLVAIMLVVIGLRTMAMSRHRHTDLHAPSDGEHPRDTPRHRVRFFRRSLLVGSMHGLAGSGALTALVAARLATTQGRLLYVAIFGLGSIVGMAALSGAAGWPLARLRRSPRLARTVTTATGVLALGLGVVWGVPLVRVLCWG